MGGIVDNAITGRSQWKAVAGLRLICQVTVLRGCSEMVAKAGRRNKVWNVLVGLLSNVINDEQTMMMMMMVQ